MVKSLQEQLMGSGLVDKKKAKALKQEKRMKQKQTPKGHVVENQTQKELEKKRLEKLERDKQLNKEKLQEQEKRAIAAQVKQLIQTNEVKRESGELAFQFTEGKKIKRIYVDQTQYDYLVKGVLAIASLDDEFILVPKMVAKKIMERIPGSICYYYDKTNTTAEEDLEEDPYKGFEIPDDLMW